MAFEVSFLFIVIGFWHHTTIIRTHETNSQDASNLEELYRVTFTNESIEEMAIVEYNDTKKLKFRSSLQNIIDERKVTFHLFTKSNPVDAYVLEVGNNDNLKGSSFNTAWKTKILIHGWQSSVPDSWIEDMTKNYLAVGDYNIIGVDWSPLSVQDYVSSTEYTRAAGKRTAELVRFLNTAANNSFDDVHVLGHSLGAHVAGLTGANLNGALSRITGMDPAGPLFEIPEKKKAGQRLDPTDAVFVDIVHTCGGIVGFYGAIGHVDFYPNGGICNQPGCALSLTCNHGRAYEFIIDSIIHPEQLVAVKCSDWSKYQQGDCSKAPRAVMGERLDLGSRGIFYLMTNPESPYGKGHKARHNSADYKTKTIIWIFLPIIISNMYKVQNSS